VVEAVDIVFWPCAMDFKREDVEKMEDRAIDVCFVNGAIRSSEQLEMAELCRKKSKVLIAFGAALTRAGSRPGQPLRPQAMMETVYHKTPQRGEPGKHRAARWKPRCPREPSRCPPSGNRSSAWIKWWTWIY